MIRPVFSKLHIKKIPTQSFWQPPPLLDPPTCANGEEKLFQGLYILHCLLMPSLIDLHVGQSAPVCFYS